MTRKDDGPGVPEAVPRTLQGVVSRLGAESVDRLWIFPPRIRGRKESGLLVVSRFADDGAPGRRRLFTAGYTAERTGKGLVVDWTLAEQGSAPPDRLPPVMDGVMRRAGDEGDEAREVGIGGDAGTLERLLGEWEPGLLDPALWPRATATTDGEVPQSEVPA